MRERERERKGWGDIDQGRWNTRRWRTTRNRSRQYKKTPLQNRRGRDRSVKRQKLRWNHGRGKLRQLRFVLPARRTGSRFENTWWVSVVHGSTRRNKTLNVLKNDSIQIQKPDERITTRAVRVLGTC